MNYWLICLPRADMKRCIDKKTFGLSRKMVINQVREGDKIICCAGKGDWKVIAAGTATSDYFVDDEPIFLAQNDLFLDRFAFDAKPLAKEVDLAHLLDKLSFVSNLAYWAVYFRNGIVKISQDDWTLLQGAR